ncbi:recombinase family protein [Streptococcus sciuri]|uniref:Recombinase family protein n=1 Tax=Streptococcus sciuri TaxID=2973939 RepID=A0ABT2F6T0_9STRE|nr:recombinase family protein [Streptococcus sciuri]MCS4487545.1 recombinase family protein [Streptococcus sciuri]
MGITVIQAKTNQKKQRVCAYVRVSTMNSRQLDSLGNQKVAFERLYSHREDVDFLGVYSDKGISGSKEERPYFQAMLEECRKGHIDLIHTKSISRFARNTLTVLEVSRELKTLGVDIFFEEQNIHTLSSEGEVMLSVLASLAEEELRSMSANQHWAFQKKFQRGELIINTKRFLGYDVNESGELIINEREAEIVRRIYQLYLSGMGMHRIAKLFNKEGVPTVTGGRWHDTTIKNILSNEKYKGSALLQKYFHDGVHGPKRLNQGQLTQYLIEDNHEAIVSIEDWQKVQDRMGRGTWNRDTNRCYPFTSMLKCQYCGSTLKRQISYKKQIVWCCSKYIKEGKSSCQGMRVAEKAIAHWTLRKPVTVLERRENGQKHYDYSSQEGGRQYYEQDPTQNQGGSLLSGIHRPRRTAIKL